MHQTIARAPDADLGRLLDAHRADLVGYCYRMLASPFEAEDAVQETMLRAWKAYDRFEGRASMRTWLHRIATNVCLDMLRSKRHRTRPMDLGPAREPIEANLKTLPEVTWIEPIPDTLVASDPEERRSGQRSRSNRRRQEARDAEALRRGVRAIRRQSSHEHHSRGREAVDAAVRPLAAGPRGHLPLVVRRGHRMQGLACHPGRHGERLAGVRP